MIVGEEDEQLSPFEALHLVRAARQVLAQQPDAILHRGIDKVAQANGHYLQAHPDELAEVQSLITLSHNLQMPPGAND